MLRAKVPFFNTNTENKNSNFASYVAPSAKCIHVIDESDKNTFNISIASGNTVQVANVSILINNSQQQKQKEEEKLRIRSSNDECSLQLPSSLTTTTTPGRIISSAIIGNNNILTVQNRDDGELTFSIIKYDAENMNALLLSKKADDEDETDRRRRQREEADQQGNAVLSLSSIFSLSSTANNNGRTLSPFSPSPSCGGGNYIGLDSNSSGNNQVVVTNSLTRSSSVLDIETHQYISSLSVIPHDGFVVASCALNTASNSGNHNLVAISTGAFVTLWDTRQQHAFSSTSCGDLQQRSQLFPATSSITCLTSFPDNKNSNLLLTGSSDRNVTLWDLRKWTKQHVAQNVLKFAPASVACCSGSSGSSNSTGENDDSTAATTTANTEGNFVTASGSDSEVRNLFVPSNNNSNNTTGGKKAKNSNKEDTTTNNVNGATGGSFRQRLQDATHCMTSWHGSWTSSQKASCTIGMSRDFELFVAKF